MPGNARLLSLLGTFASGRTFSAAELAADFAVTARTIRRDIAELRALGYIIASVPGTAGGYRAEARTMLPPLQLGSGEALATAVGLALLRGAGLNTPHADSAARKLSEMLPAQMRGSLNDIGTAVSVPQGNVPGIDIASVIALASAISGQTLATFDYTVPDRRGRGRSSPRSATAAPHGRQTVAPRGGQTVAPAETGAPRARQTVAPAETGRPTESRRVEPVQLVVLGAHWYLFAWDLVRRDWRVFRLDRMSDVHATTLEFSPRPHPDAEAAVSSAVTTAAYSHTVIIGMRSTVAEAGQWFSSRAATITEAADGVRIAFGIDDLATAATHLAMIPVPVEIIDPPELIDQMAALAQRARSTAANSGKGR